MAHMNIEDREIIEEMIKNGESFTKIGEKVNHHRTTISDEIIKHRIPSKEKTYGISFTYCMFENDCNLYKGTRCTTKCNSYKRIECPLINKPPYVCNGCSKKNGCKFQKYYYRAKDAQEMYENDLKESRTGINIPSEIIDRINEEIAPLIIKKHQTVNQVYLNHPDILYFSKSEFYKLIDLGYVNIKNIDLPRKVSYKPRKKNNSIRRTRKESIVRNNRTYIDYNNFITNNPNTNTIQLDTVEGKKGGKVFLTITFTNSLLMLIYLLDEQSAECVNKRINWIKETLGKELYKRLFKCMLTDNGKEFYDVDTMEQFNNEKITNVFYCDPSSPYQKGCCEENHHYIRYYLPKGNCDFDDLNQEDCNILMSHINSVPRDKLKGDTPFNMAKHDLGEDVLNKLGVIEISKDEVNLSTSILNGKGKKKNEK